MFKEVIDSVVIEPDGVQQAGRRLNGPRRGVAGTRTAGHCFWNDAAELRDRHEPGHLPDVAERAGCDQDGILQLQSSQPYTQVDFVTHGRGTPFDGRPWSGYLAIGKGAW